MQHDSLIQKKEDFQMETRFGTFRLRAYLQTTNKQIHLALTKGSWSSGDAVLTRINSTQVNNDILGTLTNDVDKKLDGMFKKLNEEGQGAIIFINQEVKSLELLSRLSELKLLQEKGIIKAPNVKMDNKDFGIGAQILHDIDISKIKLLSNQTQHTKRVGMIGYGLEIVDYVNY
jgi:3,4-dihydroxy 2-butanone 4-phosphate synthase/GTP cyclohydrolase II